MEGVVGHVQRVGPESKLIAGRFGRMFRNLPSFEPSNELIERIVRRMVEPARDDERFDNDRIPPGFTYPGQFVDHDLTFDPVSSLQRQNHPDGLHYFRTPNFDLDSVFGLGPADQPYLYRRDDPTKSRLGKGRDINPETGAAALAAARAYVITCAVCGSRNAPAR